MGSEPVAAEKGRRERQQQNWKREIQHQIPEVQFLGNQLHLWGFDSKMNFRDQEEHGGVFPPSFNNQHVVSFQAGTANSGMVRGNMGGPRGVILPAECSRFRGTPMAGPTLKHGATGLGVDWSFKEQAILKEGLVRFRDEPGMMKYIKIAALLPEKTVRGVALRCRWMAKKENFRRRKQEENYAGKKIKDRKERDCSAKANMHSVSSDDIAGYSFVMRHPNYNNQILCEAPTIDSGTQHLLEENVQILNQISENLSTCKLDNIGLFSRSRDYMTAILNRMGEMPGIMSHMPSLPVSTNEDLMNVILPSTSHALMFGTSNGFNSKQEPRC